MCSYPPAWGRRWWLDSTFCFCNFWSLDQMDVKKKEVQEVENLSSWWWTFWTDLCRFCGRFTVLDILAPDYIRAEPTGGSEVVPVTCRPNALLFSSPAADSLSDRCCHGRSVGVEWVSNGRVVAEVAHAASPAAAAGLSHSEKPGVCCCRLLLFRRSFINLH